MANSTNSSSHTKWLCKYHIVIVPKYRRKIIYNQYRHFWAEGYYVSTVGLNESTIKKYIQDQEKARALRRGRHYGLITLVQTTRLTGGYNYITYKKAYLDKFV